MQYYILPTDKDIQHYGVLGMKWGIRRYQPYSTVPRKSGKGGKELGEAKKHKSLYSRIGGEARENVIRKSLEDQEASEKYFKKEKDLIGSKVDKKLKLESKIRQKEEKGINTDREVSELKKIKKEIDKVWDETLNSELTKSFDIYKEYRQMNKDYLNNTLLGKAESLIGTKAMDNLLGSRKNQQSKESLKKNGHPDYVRDDDGTKEIYEKTIDKLYSKSLDKIIEENIKYHNEFNKAAKEWDKWYTGAQDRKAKTQEEANKFYNEPGAKLNASSNVLMNKVSEKEYNKIQSEAYEISTGSKINKKRLDSFIIFGYK